jgi:signal transduction histidine kinase
MKIQHISFKSLFAALRQRSPIAAQSLPKQRWRSLSSRKSPFFQRLWSNRSFRTKLSLLLLGSAALPILVVTYGVVQVAEENQLTSLQQSLKKDLSNLQSTVQQSQEGNDDAAQSLARSIVSQRVNPNQLNDRSRTWLNELIRNPIQTRYAANFYLITDQQGKTVAQNVRQVNESSEFYPSLPVAGGQATFPPQFTPVSINSGIDLSAVDIVREVLRRQRPLAGVELIQHQVLKQLKLDQQATIGVRSQPTQDIPLARQPFPEGTFDIEQGQIGLVVMAVEPIMIQGKMVGTAIVGTLLNRNYQIVDSIQQNTGVSTATLFALDWRVSTNVPYSDRKTRAIGTRLARSVADQVLYQKQTYIGEAQIVGQPYMTAYAPLYDHRYQINTQRAEPIGVYYVGEPKTAVQQLLNHLSMTGFAIGGIILILSSLIGLPIAFSLSRSIRKLTQFAQRMGSGEFGVRVTLDAGNPYRQDEIGILSRELNHMAERIEHNLAQVNASELQIREKTTQLESTLQQLQRSQAQLVQSAKMSGLEQLVAGVAHEINNPVSFIYGNVDYAIEYVQDLLGLLHLYQSEYPQPSEAITQVTHTLELDFLIADLTRLLNSMKTGATRIREIVQSLRTFSRLDETGVKSINIHDSLDSTLTLLEHRLYPSSIGSAESSSKITIVKNYSELPTVKCYPAAINQVFLHLLNNAIDAITQATHPAPTICIHTEMLDRAVAIRIRNTGNPIPPDVQLRMFDPFFTTKPIGQGTGMGLAISYQTIVDQHQGKLYSRSPSTTETEFVVELPVGDRS